MDQESTNILNTYIFLEDMSIVTNGTLENHCNAVKVVFGKIESSKRETQVGKCNLAEKVIEVLGYILTKTGISPINSKTLAVTDKLNLNVQKSWGHTSG